MTTSKTIREQGRPCSSSHPNPTLLHFLWGRKLLFEECQTFSNDDIQEYIKIEPGISMLCCGRCGNSDSEFFGSYLCDRCGDHCQYCRACLTMGTIKSCSQLLTWEGPPPELVKLEKIDIRWPGELSPLQQKASDALRESLRKQEDFLIWAVTGAGKTEILYETIRDALMQGLRVGIVSPRTDVIIELSNRLMPIFSDVPSITLYGDSPDSYVDVPLILSTTHQLLRFDHLFDVFFIDEVDAFPFHNNPMLENALKRAGKKECLRFYLTATPTNKMKQKLKNGSINGIKIPIRYHGHPLPEPRFQWLGSWKKQLARGRLPNRLTCWIEERLKHNRPGFIFVPTIDTAVRLVPLLHAIHPSIEAVHSEDPDRHEKVANFRKGNIPILVTTTILERGVTIPFLDVAVIGADEPVFDERALVQISGRVGRDNRNPSGDIVFFHKGITLGMLGALHHIRDMNREGRKM